MGQTPRPVGSRQGQEGARWYNERPKPEDVAKWFKENAPIDSDLDAARYVGGLTMIEAWDYAEEARRTDSGTIAVKVRNRVFTPYVKVETRVQYFWDLMSAKDTLGVIERVPVGDPRQDMPEGFFVTSIPDSRGNNVRFVGCAMRVRVLDKDSARYETIESRHSAPRRVLTGKPIIEAPTATKLVPLLVKEGYNSDNYVPDPYALMKAETGATGRALGLAGMLVLPGTGVATAEDMQEAQAQGDLAASDAPEAPEPPAAPPVPEEAAGEPVDPDTTLREEIEAKLKKLQTEHPDRHTAFQKWAQEERKMPPLAECSSGQLRGITRKLDKALAGEDS